MADVRQFRIGWLLPVVYLLSFSAPGVDTDASPTPFRRLAPPSRSLRNLPLEPLLTASTRHDLAPGVVADDPEPDLLVSEAMVNTSPSAPLRTRRPEAPSLRRLAPRTSPIAVIQVAPKAGPPA